MWNASDRARRARTMNERSLARSKNLDYPGLKGPWGRGIRARERRPAMPSYVMLAKFTDQGIRNIKDSPKRQEAFRNLCEKAGVKVKDVYRTMGRYDVVATLGALGNLHTETLRAFTRQETEQAIAKMP
jgi:uncharacterized protein with GYD domain